MKVGFQSSFAFMRTLLTNRLLVLLPFLLSGQMTAQDDAGTLERQSKAREFFINGTTLQLQGNRHAEAILEFQESLSYDSSATTLTAMARSYLELAKLDRAEKCIRASLAMDDRSRDSWEVLAEVLIASGKYDEGVEAYEHVRTLRPTKRQLYTLGRLYEPRNADKAIDVFEELVKADPDLGVYRRLAVLYQRKKNTDGVIRSLERARELDEENPGVVAELILAYLADGRLGPATDAAHRFQKTAPGPRRSEEVWAALLGGISEDSLLANMYAEDVQHIIDEAERIHEGSAYIHLLAGTLSLRIGDLPRAKGALQKTSQLAADNPDVLLQIGVIYLRDNETEAAIQHLTEWQSRHAHDARFLVLIGDAMWSLERLSEAAVYYHSALELDPLLPDTWAQLGMVYDLLNDVDRSDTAYRRSLEIDPMNATASNNFAYSLALRGKDINKARELSWNAVQQHPENAAYLDTYAWVLFKSGDPERARTYIEKAVRIGGNATHFEHWGDILEALGEYDAAVAAWKESLDRDPTKQDVRTKIDRYR